MRRGTIMRSIASVCVSVCKADGRRSKFLVRETRERNLVQETCIQVAHRTIQVSRTRNMADDRDNKKFQILFFRIAIHNQQNGQKDEKIRNY